MVSYSEQKPITTTRAKTEFDRAENGIPRAEVRITQSNTGYYSTFGYVIAGFLLVVGAYFLISHWGPATVEQPVSAEKVSLPTPATITQDATTPLAPAAVTPGSTTPPVGEKAPPITPDSAKSAQ